MHELLAPKGFMQVVNATEEETRAIYESENIPRKQYWGTPIDRNIAFELAAKLVDAGTHEWLINDPRRPGRKRVNRAELTGNRRMISITLDDATIERIKERYPDMSRGDVLENAFWDMEVNK